MAPPDNDKLLASDSEGVSSGSNIAGHQSMLNDTPETMVAPKIIDGGEAAAAMMEEEWDSPFDNDNAAGGFTSEWPVQKMTDNDNDVEQDPPRESPKSPPSKLSSSEQQIMKRAERNKLDDDVETCDEFSDNFSDVFQGNVVEVTKNFMDRLSTNTNKQLLPPRASTSTNHTSSPPRQDGMKKIHSTVENKEQESDVELSDKFSDVFQGNVVEMSKPKSPMDRLPTKPSPIISSPSKKLARISTPSEVTDQKTLMNFTTEKKEDNVETCDEFSDMFSDVFQENVVDVTKSVMERLRFNNTTNFTVNDNIVEDPPKGNDDNNVQQRFEKGTEGEGDESITGSSKAEENSEVGDIESELNGVHDINTNLPLSVPATQTPSKKDIADSTLAWGALAAILGSPAPSSVSAKQSGAKEPLNLWEDGEDATLSLPSIDVTVADESVMSSPGSLAVSSPVRLTYVRCEGSILSTSSAIVEDRHEGRSSAGGKVDNTDDIVATNGSKERPDPAAMRSIGHSPEKRLERRNKLLRRGGHQKPVKESSITSVESLSTVPPSQKVVHVTHSDRSTPKSAIEIGELLTEAINADFEDMGFKSMKESLQTRSDANHISGRQRGRTRLRKGEHPAEESDKALVSSPTDASNSVAINKSKELLGTTTSTGPVVKRLERRRLRRSASPPAQRAIAAPNTAQEKDNDDDNSISTNNSKDTLGTATSTGSSNKLRLMRRLRPSKSPPAKRLVPTTNKEEDTCNNDGDNSITTKKSKDTPGTARSSGPLSEKILERRKLRRSASPPSSRGVLAEDNNSITSDNSKGALVTAPLPSPTSDKRRERRRLRRSASPPSQRSPVGLNTGEDKVGKTGDSSIITSNSKGSADPIFDNCREWRKFRRSASPPSQRNRSGSNRGEVETGNNSVSSVLTSNSKDAPNTATPADITLEKRSEWQKLRLSASPASLRTPAGSNTAKEELGNEDDTSIMTNKSKVTLGTVSSVNSSPDKRRERRQLRRGEQKKPVDDSSGKSMTTAQPESKTEEDIGDIESKYKETREGESSKRRDSRQLRRSEEQKPGNATAAAQSTQALSAVSNTGEELGEFDDNSISTSLSKETLESASDKRRERRQIRQCEQPKSSNSALAESLNIGEGMGQTNDEVYLISPSNCKEIPGTAVSADTSEKRRERRKLRKQGNEPNDDNLEEAIGGNVESNANISFGNDCSAKDNVSKELVSEKRRERRKLRKGEEQQPEPPPSTESPPDTKAIIRQKIADRVAKGQIPIPKALLKANQKPSNQDIASSSALSGGLVGASTIAVAGEIMDDGCTDIPGDVSGSRSLPKTPISTSKKIPTSTNVKTPTTPTNSTANSASPPSSQRLIVTPTNEVEMKLVEGGDNHNAFKEGETEETLSLPNLQNAPELDLDKNGARRPRRHLRKGPVSTKEHLEMAFKVCDEEEDSDWDSDSSEDGHISPIPSESGLESSPGKQSEGSRIKHIMSDKVKSALGNVLEQDQSLRRAASARSSSPTSSFASSFPGSSIPGVADPEVSKQISQALENARRQKHEQETMPPPPPPPMPQDSSHANMLSLVDSSSVDYEEAKTLFPQGDSFPMSSDAPPPPPHLSSNDSAWDANGASGLSTILEKSKAQNKENAQMDGRPLLHLETISSDNDAQRTLEAASAKLMSQKERMAMYTSAGGFGVGEDSSIEPNDSESHATSRCDSEDEGDTVGVEVSDSRVLFDYEDMNNIIDDSDQSDENVEEEALDSIHQFVPQENNNAPQLSLSETPPTISQTENRASRWAHNPDAMSEADDEVEFLSTTDAGSVRGLRFVGSTVCSGSTNPTPPQSPFEMIDLDATPKTRTRSSYAPDKSNADKSPAKLLKIPPPPPEKLKQWQESKGLTIGQQGLSKSMMAQASSAGTDKGRTVTTKQDSDEQQSPAARLAQRASDEFKETQQHRRTNSLNNYKIQFPKSPLKQKKGSLVEELDLASHKKMAEKFAIASSKAARTFEEKYASSHQHGKSHRAHYSEDAEIAALDASSKAALMTSGSFLCAADPRISPSTSRHRKSSHHHSTAGSGMSTPHDSPTSNPNLTPMQMEMQMQMPHVGELTRGAFSPWKIPDRVDDDQSSVYTNASSSIARGPGEANTNKDESLNESFEVSLDEDRGGGLLTSTLHWLFDDVLHSDSSLAAAFSAFDINTSTTVQSGRVLAIANDDESFNKICSYVAASVLKRRGYGKAGSDSSEHQEDGPVPHTILSSDNDAEDNASILTYESSFISTSTISETSRSNFAQKAAARILKGKARGVDPFEIPLFSDGRPSADVLAANFVGFLRQISKLTPGIPSPFGNDNPFLTSVVHNLTASAKSNKTDKTCARREPRASTMQALIFPNEDRVVAIFTFFHKACGYGIKEDARKGDGADVAEEKVRHMLSAIEEGDSNNKGGGKSKSENVVVVDTTTEAVVSPQMMPDTVPRGAISPSRTCSHSEIHGATPGGRGSGGKRPSTVRRSNMSGHRSKGSSSHHHHKSHRARARSNSVVNLNLICSQSSPSPFETAVWNAPSIVLSILSFIGSPVAVCVVKRLNVFCNRVVCENQHVLMRDAVRLGGMSKYVRPSFWLWVTERCRPEDPIPLVPSRRGFEPNTHHKNGPSSSPIGSKYRGRDFHRLKDLGGKGKWQHVIERDVTRSFGNMPPHKTGARYRQDSIVRALVSFGKEEIMRNSRSYQAMDKLPETEAKHFKLSSRLDRRDDDDSAGSNDSGSLTPTDTVSDWGGISPVGSLVSEEPSVPVVEDKSNMHVVSYENGDLLDSGTNKASSSMNKLVNVSQITNRSDVSDPALSGNALTSDMKVDLQCKLRSILHALAARHEAVGYCQGMDYIVAHLLRVLQDTILLRVVQRSMPSCQNQITDQIVRGGVKKNKNNDNTDQALETAPSEDWRTISSEELRARMSAVNSQTVVVEEVVFNVMDTFFSTYNLQHMYWPELRCLKTCCRVFESLITQKLPVLADHFEHYDLNVGLFALGWFQTLFLYLPSMPSATVCHIWDIWLVERSYKIFFRVGTAILFLSQPTLLNHDLEGMMTYLNTFPDATLLRRDILIPCALQIKITNRMLVEIELEVAKFNQSQEQGHNGEYFPV